MSTLAVAPLMTVEELLALPDDGFDRDLFQGRLRKRATARRSRRHARTTTNLAHVVCDWKDQLSPPAGEVPTGDAQVLFGVLQDLAGSPESPGLRVKVADLFAH